jgi:hypothetical protein
MEQKIILALHIKLLSLVCLTCSMALALGENEAKWRRSIEADIQNGAPADDICRNALSPATVSDEVAFKNWAYGIARTYCPPGKVGPLKASPATDPAVVNPELLDSPMNCPLLSSHDARRVARGERVKLQGGGCLMIFNGLR